MSNWHWKEKNCTPWATNFLESSLQNAKLEQPLYLWITQANVFGDVDINQRKGRLLYFYDIKLDLKWEGKSVYGGDCSGNFVVEEFSSEMDSPSDLQCQFVIEKTVNEISSELKHSAKIALRELVWHKLTEFRTALCEQGKPLLEKENENNQHEKLRTSDRVNASYVDSKAASEETLRTLHLEWSVLASPSDIFQVLLDQNKVKIWSGSNASIVDTVGSEFSLFDGSVVGKILSLEKDSRIEMKWKPKEWNSYSTAAITLRPGNGCTQITLVQSDIPSSELQKTKENWRKFYWNQIQATFGYQILNK